MLSGVASPLLLMPSWHLTNIHLKKKKKKKKKSSINAVFIDNHHVLVRNTE